MFFDFFEHIENIDQNGWESWGVFRKTTKSKKFHIQAGNMLVKNVHGLTSSLSRYS